MLQTEKSPVQNIALYCAVAIMLGYILYEMLLKYLSPITESNAEIYNLLSQAQTYSFIGKLVFVSGLVIPGIFAAWKNKKFRMMFPALLNFQLTLVMLTLK